MRARSRNLADLRRVVRESAGPGRVVAIANGGDSEVVGSHLRGLAADIFRADGAVDIRVHEERIRRGQLLGLLDALRDARAAGFAPDPDGVAVGIMLPGKGTRLSPLTQRLHGIKPFLPTLIRQGPDRPWLNAAAASLYTWTLVAHHLARMGFRGVAWKWGDEPQIPDLSLAAMDLDLSAADAVRFGSEVEITDDLAENKEWLQRDPENGDLVMQVRRRSRPDLLRRFGITGDGPARALVHIGSPAFSHRFLEEAEAAFGGLEGWIDVDGYLFEALTHGPEEWAEEIERDPGLAGLVAERPDFYERARGLKARLEQRRGHRFVAKVIDFGADLYWGDIGQLARAREALWAVADPGPGGRFPRELAAIDEVSPDAHGNRVVGDCVVPDDGRVRDSVLVDARLGAGSEVAGAVVVASDLDRAAMARGAVVHGCTAGRMEVGRDGFAFRSVGEAVAVPDHHVHTSLPVDPEAPERGLEDWMADVREDPGRGANYTEPLADNPDSFAAKFAQMRQRRVSPTEIERAVDRMRDAVRARFTRPRR